ncbi:MAG: efflux RND transporter permease subunit [wastewater metagenome]|nr:efflux RND transporter permease subunit [Candidatus Loosdrechtia aerotolerans]
MSLSSVSIERPVLAIVMSIVVILFGIIGYRYLGVREYPNIDQPVITVSTTYIGANSDIIESQISDPLEESINGIAGIQSLTSVSRDGRSTIIVEFGLDTDLEAAANDVRDRVFRAIGNLPSDIDPPIISKSDADTRPIIFLNITSDKRSLLELSEIAEKTFKERLQTIPGVSEIRIWGEKKYAMRLWMDAARLAAYQLTPLDIRDALLRENVELPSGSIEGGATELTVRTLGRLATPQEFNNLIIRENGGGVVRFQDVGYAELGPENLNSVLKRDGIPMVGNAIVPQPGSNHIEIADEFYKRIQQIKKDLPDDIILDIGFDTTKYVRESITEVQQTIFIAFCLVICIIFCFLRDWRTTIIPLLAIPISLIGSFFIMYLAGFSVNVLSLLGVVLAIGLVVDDAIIVLENIYTKIEKGMNPVEAGIKGSSEIFFAVIATTLTLAVVFLPVIFLKGIVGKLFSEFGIVLTGAVVISSFVALTLTPMLSTKILKRRETHTWFYKKTEPFFIGLTNAYRNSLEAFMRKRLLAFGIMILAIGFIFGIGVLLPSELAPLEDRSGLRLHATAPEGASYEYMDMYMDELIELIKEEVPEAEGIISITSPNYGASSSINSGVVTLRLNEPAERTRTQEEIADYLGGKVRHLPSARTYISQEQTIGDRRSSLPVEYVIQAANIEKLKDVLPAFLAQAYKSPVFQFVDVNLKFNKPELKVKINREKAKNLHVSTMDIVQTLQLAFTGHKFGYFLMNGKQYQVIGQLKKEDRNEPLDLKSLFVRNQRGDMVQLDNVVSLYEESSPPQLYRYNRYLSATISAGLAKGKTIEDGITEMDAISDRVLDETFSTALSGLSKDYVESSSSMSFVFFLALALVYLVLAAQFESFRDPLIIMFTVPLAIAGAVVSLWYFKETLNIFSQIGIIMLVGLVVKNGILIVEFANQKKSLGLNSIQAVQEAATLRFRPVLMTSLSTILGALPIALALGAGSEGRTAMGIAIIGGLSFSTILTLYVVPAIYSYFSKDLNMQNT